MSGANESRESTDPVPGQPYGTAVTRQSNGELALGGVPLSAIAGKEVAVGGARVGTPTYVYDLDGVASEARELERAFEDQPHLVAYAVKANSAGPIVRALAQLSEREQDVLRVSALYFKADGHGRLPHEVSAELGARWGIGNDNVRAIRKRALEKLRRLLAATDSPVETNP